MRIKWTVLLWMLMISGLLAAQNTANTSFQVKGILLDSLTREGEPYATIKIVKKEAPAKALKMLVTDMKGQFQERVPGTGNFVMTITSVGRTPINARCSSPTRPLSTITRTWRKRATTTG